MLMLLSYSFINSFEGHVPVMMKVPQFLADTKYENPADVLHSAFQLAFQTDLPAFVFAASKPEMIVDFQVGQDE